METNLPQVHQGTHGLPGPKPEEAPKSGLAGTFLLACKVRLYNFSQFFKNLFSYYIWYPKFFLADTFLLLLYFFKSPYTMCREYDERHPKTPVGPYGETDFQALDSICTAFKISPNDTVADLGSGRGRLTFFLKLVRQQKEVFAFEQVPLMVQRAKKIQRLLSIEDVHFHHEDWREASFAGIDTIYLYSLSLNDQAIKKLATLPKSTKIITIGSWLGEDFPDLFHLEKRTHVHFMWGKTEAFLQSPVG
jgi:SAM-dependent methyltransferase